MIQSLWALRFILTILVPNYNLPKTIYHVMPVCIVIDYRYFVSVKIVHVQL